VLEILPVGVWVMDKTPQVILGNPESQRIWADARYVEMQHGDQYFAWRVDTGAWLSAEEWAGRLAITRGQTTLNEELEIETFDGDRRSILNSAIPLVIEGEGLVGAIVVNQDITRRKQNEEELQRAHDQLSTLLNISQSLVSTLDLDPLLNLIIEQLGTVLPYDAAAILILEQNFLQVRVMRGPSFLQSLSQYKIPINEPTLIEPLINEREPFYIPDLLANEDLLYKIQDFLRKLSSAQFTTPRSWLAHPLIAKDGFIGILVLAHSQPDYYSPQSRILSQAYANQVAIAIHNAQLYEQAGSLATLEERNRLARELHDSVAQALYSISLFTDAMRRALETNRLEVAKQHLGDLVELSKEAMADMRLMIFELRPPILEKIGLVAALQSRLDSVESRAGFQAIFQADGEFHFSLEQEGELYRIAQEALNNVIKHAQAGWVLVKLAAEPGIFKMTIEDNGVGFDLTTAEQSGGQGLRNIRERSDHLGAVCRIESTPGQGTKITIEVNQ
jgi:signal transduction histidine kinase